MLHIDIPVHSLYTSRINKTRDVLGTVIAPPQLKAQSTSQYQVDLQFRYNQSRNPHTIHTPTTTVVTKSNKYQQKNMVIQKRDVQMSYADFMEEDQLGYGFQYDDGIFPPPLNLTKLSSNHKTCKTIDGKVIPTNIIGELSLEELLYVSQTLKQHNFSSKFGNQCVLLHCKMKYKRLLRQIKKSFPNCRLLSRRNKLCYRKASKFINTLKSFCISSCDLFLRRGCWDLTLEYALRSWTMIDQLPDWEDKEQNKSKQICFKKLSDTCCVALKSGAVKITPNIAKRLNQVSLFDESISKCMRGISKS